MKDRMMKNISGNCFAMPKSFNLTGEPGRKIVIERHAGLLRAKSSVSAVESGIEISEGNNKYFYSRDSIRQIYYRQYTESGSVLSSEIGEVVSYYVLEMIAFDNGIEKNIVLMKRIPSVYLARFFEQEAEMILGIDDCAVQNEYDFQKKINNFSNYTPSNIAIINSTSGIKLERKDDPAISKLRFAGIVGTIIFLFFLYRTADLDNKLPFIIALFMLLILCWVLFLQCRRSAVTITDTAFAVSKKNILNMENYLATYNLNDVNYAYPFEKPSGDSKHNSEFSVKIACNNDSNIIEAFERTDQNIAEFVADRINAEISRRRNN